MPRPTPVPDSIIETHVGGGPSFARGRRYYAEHRVARRAWRQGHVHAAVRGQGPRPYEVEVALEATDRIAWSSCACPMGGGCKHVAATLIAYGREPHTFAELPTPLGAPGPADWGDWSRERGVEDLLEVPIAQVFSTWRLYELPVPKHTPIASVLSASVQGSLAQRAALDRAKEDLRDWLEDEARHRHAARAYQEQAQTWRSHPPAEPWLQDLYHYLRAEEIAAPAHLGPVTRPDESQVERSEDPPSVTIALASGERVGPIPLGPGDEAPALHAEALRTLLDLLTHPALADSATRAWIAATARVPAWERALRALDAVAERAGPATDEGGREPGWRVEQKGFLRLTPVWVRPYKTRSGLRTWPMGTESAQLVDAGDREALDILRGYGHTRDAMALRALDCLVGHPRIIWERGQHVALRRGELGLDWVPEVGGVALVPTLDGEALDPDALLSALRSVAGERLLWIDEARSRLVLCACPPTVATLLHTIVSRARHFPPEAVTSMLRRYEALAEIVPMRLRGHLRGEPVAPDRRPLVRLSPSPDGAMEVVVRSRVIAGTRPQPPGRGPEEVAAVIEGVRVFAERDLDAEIDAFHEAIAPLDLPDQDGFTWQLATPELALPVVVALRQHQANFQVEWVRPPPRVSRPAVASDVRLAISQRRDWFGVEGGLTIEDDTLSLAELLAAVRRRQAFIRLGDGGFMHLSRRLMAQLDDAAARTWESRGGLAIAPLAIETLSELHTLGAEVELPETFHAHADRLREAQHLEPGVPTALQAVLRPYQVEGFQFLARLAHWAPGAVLADDMGLGKTVQTLALLLHRAETGPALVVAPASVHTNWLREAARFAPSLTWVSYRGPHRLEHLERLAPGQVLVTSWDLLTRDVEALRPHSFGTVVFDEAQAIKNPATHRARASAALDARFVVALTGTPVENRVSDIWSLFRTTVPGLLGPGRHFRERFVAPIERDRSSVARASLARLIRPFLLRRLKSEVAKDLPPREEVEVRIALSKPERTIYERFRSAAVQALGGGDDERFQVLAALTRLRQLACDARLVDPNAPITSSAKLDRLVHLASDLRDGGHQVLVFSQFTGLLDLASEALHAADLAVRRLDGSMSLSRRQAEVDAFQEGDGDVFLISLKAGGLGLNLTAASYVVHLDPWWNPAAEDQATDRAHRIGQDRPVTVYRFVSSETVEEQVVALHRDKRQLVADLLAGSNRAPAMSPAELRALLGEALSPDEEEPEPAAPAPWDEPLLLRFQALVEEELDAGAIAKPSVAQDYRRVVNRLVGFVRARGGSLREPEDVQQWGIRYLEAVELGEVAGARADQRHAEPAFRRLGRLLLSAPPPGA